MRLPGGRAGSQFAGIGSAIAVASVAGYLLLAVVGRMLTPAEFGLFVAFWGVLFGIGSSLSTIEQETARRTATGDEESQPTVRAVTAAAAVLAALVAAATTVPALATRLYGDAGSGMGGIVILAAFGFAVQFAIRGQLIGADAVRSYSGIVVLEAVSRIVLLGALALTVGVDLVTAGIAVAIGSFAWLAWPRQARQLRPARWAGVSHGWAAVRRATSLMFAAALTASIITAYPTLVSVLAHGEPGEARGAVFAALTVSRVPLLLVSPIQALAVPAVVRWRAEAGLTGRSRLRSMLIRGTAASVVLGVIGALAGWVLGPWAVRLVYGPQYDIAPAAVAMLILSAFVLAWVLLLSAALIAVAAYRRMVAMWLLAVAVTIGWLLISPLDIVATTAVGALVGPLAAVAWGVPVLWSLFEPPLTREQRV